MPETDVRTKPVRQALPESFSDQEAYVLKVLAGMGGVLVYQNLNCERDLCEKFNVRKRDYHPLRAAIKRLVDVGTVSRELKEVRKKETFVGGWTNPASRQVTLRLPKKPEPQTVIPTKVAWQTMLHDRAVRLLRMIQWLFSTR